MSRIFYFQICDDCQHEDYYPCNKEHEFKPKEKCDECGSRDVYVFEEMS